VARNEQLIRQHKLLHLLEESRYGRTLTELRDELVDALGLSNLSERTVRRDLEALQAAGFDVDIHDSQRGSLWKLGPSLRRPARISASATELLALSMGRNLLLPLRGTPYWQGIESLWHKMKDSLPEPVWKHFTRRRQSVLVRGTPAKSYDRQQGIVATLNRAIQQHRVVQIDYQALGQSQAALREIEPYAMVLHQGSLYVVAASCDAPTESAMRHWKLDRFHRATPLDRRFQPRADFDAEQHFADSLGMYKSGQPQRFRIRFSRRAASWIAEDPWHAQQQLELQADGGAIVTIPAAYEQEIISRVLALGEDAELLEPITSRQSIAALLGSLCGKYLDRHSEGRSKGAEK
jgi:predicted DNA-binding transcriptional regulator YafY